MIHLSHWSHCLQRGIRIVFSDVVLHSAFLAHAKHRTFDPDITHQQIEWVLGKACGKFARCFFMIVSAKQLNIVIFTSCQEDSTGNTAATFDEVWANLEADWRNDKQKVETETCTICLSRASTAGVSRIKSIPHCLEELCLAMPIAMRLCPYCSDAMDTQLISTYCSKQDPPRVQDGDLERLDIDPLEQSFARLADERQEYLDLKKAANSESMPIVKCRLKSFSR